MLSAVRDAVVDAMARLWANPHSPHAAGRDAAIAVDRARSAVGALARRPAQDVIFTSGATEANALALSGLTTAERPERWCSAVEHPSVLAWADQVLPVTAQGLLDLDALDDALAAAADRVAVLSVMAANNETGVLQPLDEVKARVEGTGIVFHCDASQLPGRSLFEVPADLITLSAHKMGGPRGVGALVGLPAPRPLLRGGPQERGRRAGTVNVPGVVGMGVAARLAAEAPPFDPRPRDRLEAACRALGATIAGEGAPRLPNTTCARFPWPGDLLVAALDLEGIAASTGSACASGAPDHSHVMDAMGLDGVPVRFSLGRDTDVGAAIAALETVIARMGVACAS